MKSGCVPTRCAPVLGASPGYIRLPRCFPSPWCCVPYPCCSSLLLQFHPTRVASAVTLATVCSTRPSLRRAPAARSRRRCPHLPQLRTPAPASGGRRCCYRPLLGQAGWIQRSGGLRSGTRRSIQARRTLWSSSSLPLPASLSAELILSSLLTVCTFFEMVLMGNTLFAHHAWLNCCPGLWCTRILSSF